MDGHYRDGRYDDDRIPETLEELRAILVADRAATGDRIAELSRDLEAMIEASSLVSADDEHDPEGSTIAFERSQTSTFLADARKHLDELDRALERMDTGDYGVCERCGNSIAPGRLAARPATRTCIDCAA